MRILPFFYTALALLCSQAYSETLSAQETVTAFIQNAQKSDSNALDQLADFQAIASHKRHAMNKESVIEFLKNIDTSQIEFSKNASSELTQSTTIRMLKPISYDFDLKLQKGTPEHQEDHFVVIGLHP
jgi:hypothetical protein